MHRYAHKRLRTAWLLLLVYVPMMIAVAFHHHDEAAAADAVVSCQDCAHHVHHSGHIYALQNAMHDCALCQLQNTPYLSPRTILLAAAVVTMHVIRIAACSKCKSVAIDTRSTRAPPYACFFFSRFK